MIWSRVLSIFALISSGVTTTFLVAGQDIPPSPCPEVFNYDTEPSGNVFGRITLPYDGSSNIRLGVNASMKGYYINDQRVKLTIKMNTPGQALIERKTNIVNYDIYFPFQNAIPKITRIEYNHRVYCTGPPEELIPGASGVTNIWSGHTYYFQRANNNPPSNSFEPSQPDPAEEVVKPTESNARFPDVTLDFAPPAHAAFPPSTTRPTPSNAKIECGVSKPVIVPLIIGGKEVEEGMFPWLVAMFIVNEYGYAYKCTTNLISNKHVVTAARCVSFFKQLIVQPEDMLFVFGRSNLKHWATSGAVTRGASAVHSHPDFNPNSGHGDIAIITLDRPVEFSETISPICLWDGDNEINAVINHIGKVAGWGADEGAQKSGRFSISTAKSVEMPIVPEQSCLDSDLSYYQLTSNITFCAGRRDGTGTCIGDDGAGFMLNRNGKYYLRGLASKVLTDNGKCKNNSFMIFSDAAKLKDWINKSMRN